MTYLKELETRNLIQDCTDKEALGKLPPGAGFYVGFDPTAPSLQVGNLVPLLASIHLAKAGLKPFILFGGATGSIGDPSGRSTERNLLDDETVRTNVARQEKKVREIFERFGLKVNFLNNRDWTSKLSFLDFLRDVGKFFTVNYMLQKEVVKNRLSGEGISYTEFSYMLLQANDFLYLYQNHGIKLQVGGSDQWGNLTAGLELIRRKIGTEAHALSFPLIVDSQGKKFGKSASGAVWIDEEFLSPFKFHQFWLNVDDNSVGNLLRVFTLIPIKEIEEIEKESLKAPEKRIGQKALADAICTFVHGDEATKDAKKSAEVLFGGSLDGLSDKLLLDIFSDVPSTEISKDEFKSLTFIDLFLKTKLSKSKSDARRLMTDGGAYVNNERISDPSQTITGSSFEKLSLLVLRSGKKNYHLIKIN